MHSCCIHFPCLQPVAHPVCSLDTRAVTGLRFKSNRSMSVLIQLIVLSPDALPLWGWRCEDDPVATPLCGLCQPQCFPAELEKQAAAKQAAVMPGASHHLLLPCLSISHQSQCCDSCNCVCVSRTIQFCRPASPPIAPDSSWRDDKNVLA